jgi:hypothetical protein
VLNFTGKRYISIEQSIMLMEENTEKPSRERELQNCLYIIDEIKILDSTVETDEEFRRKVNALIKISDA